MSTSFAPPLVSGAASLLLAERPSLSPAAVATILERTARPFPEGQCDRLQARSCGAGVLDIAAAVEAARTWSGGHRVYRDSTCPNYGEPCASSCCLPRC